MKFLALPPLLIGTIASGSRLPRDAPAILVGVDLGHQALLRWLRGLLDTGAVTDPRTYEPEACKMITVLACS